MMTSAEGHVCFFCGEALQDPAIMWGGIGGPPVLVDDTPPGQIRGIIAGLQKRAPVYPALSIYLHPPCLMDLFLRLMQDVYQIGYRPRDRSE
jgi:hypothetical protein